ncbi:MAG: potassium-transporting ATPase subunit KdpA [Candidatus Manganitrophus sp.]|nr:MAG: potassium-transporting ATPase subunit KdpA [Candidatus Manganitrophus sp.]
MVLIALVKPLGLYMARVFEGKPVWLDRLFKPIERLIYRLCGVREDEEMNWQHYTVAMLLFSLVGLIVLYLQQRLQGFLPLNPQGFGAVSPDSAFNTAVSFAYQHQLAGLRRRGDDELPHADARPGGAELPLGGHRHRGAGRADPRLRAPFGEAIGNFWVDLTRSTLYVLLPLSLCSGAGAGRPGRGPDFRRL